jgi:ribosomal protein S18 acetylase RimI-like enzyme
VSAAVEIERREADVIDELEPLWLTLKNHHGACTPGQPVYDDATSWRQRKEEYADWVAEEGSFFLVARDGGRAVGYALVLIHAGSPTWIEPPRLAVVQDLAVASDQQGKGVGRALLDSVHDESGCDVVELAVLSANESAVRFYERLGFERRVETLRRRRQII